MLDHLAAGDTVEVAPPAGFFQLAGHGPIVAFGAGSGITPIFSLLKTALARTSRPVHLLYANRDSESVIFRQELDALTEAHGERLHVVHHFDVDDGFVDANTVRALTGSLTEAEHYICGPTPFMDIVE